jgi:hypothetical protein
LNLTRVLAASWLVACTRDDLQGDYFDVTFTGVEDTCSGQAPSYTEDVTYRVVIEGQGVEVAVGSDVFATGRADGCNIEYTSIVWTEDRDGASISWQISGEAAINVGGGNSCPIGDGVDWLGIETFEIISSEDPAYAPGCGLESEAVGNFVETVK